MITTRPVRRDQLEDWLAIGVDDPANERLAGRITAAWADGSGGPELTFVAQDETGTPVGRLAFTYAPVAGAMPDVHEGLAIGLWLDWADTGSIEIGRRLVVDNVGALPPSVIALDAHANPEYMAVSEARRAVFEAAELPLFQEKEGFVWTPETSPPPPVEPTLTFRPITDVGRELYAATMSRATSTRRRRGTSTTTASRSAADGGQ